jgi:hypothetical protein
MPEEAKKLTAKTQPKELPMPKYGYQRQQGGSVSSAYRATDERKREPELQLHNIQFSAI